MGVFWKNVISFNRKENMDTEEDILVAIYINLIDMVMHLPGIYQPSNRLIASKKDIRNILLLRTALLANDKYEVAKRNRCFLANFVRFSRTPFSQSTSGRVLL